MAAETASKVRALAFRNRSLNFAKTCSIGLRAGEYLGRKTRRAPTSRIAWRTALPLCEPRLSRITTSPFLSVGARNCSTLGAKALAVDGAVEQAGRVDAVGAQGGEEGRGLPAAVRDLVDEALALRGPAVEAGHVGFGPSLVDEDETGGIDAALIGSPARPMPADVRPVLFARDERLFLRVTPIRRKNRLIIEVSALTPFSAESRSHSS